MSRLSRVLFLVLPLLAVQGCDSASHYRRHRDGKSLYAVLYKDVSNGDTIEKIKNLLGPGQTFASPSIETIMKHMKTDATKRPDKYPDGVQDDDVLIEYAISNDGFIVLPFRDGRLVNYVREQFRKYEYVEPIVAF